MVSVEHEYEDLTVNFSIIKLSGHVRTSVINESSLLLTNNADGKYYSFPVVNGQFIAFCELSIGSNVIALQYGFYAKTLQINYITSESPYHIQPLYIICEGDDGRFQGPSHIKTDVTTAQTKIGFSCKLLQTFVAHSLEDQGLELKTFNIPLDSSQNVIVRIHRSKLTCRDVYSMNQVDLWTALATEIVASADLPHRKYCKYLAFLSCTRYNGSHSHPSWKHHEVVSATQGYVNIGGGGLALLGTGSLHTWPESLQDLVHSFTNEDFIDQTKLLDDSAYRRTYWANLATSLGASLHELCHTLDLHHTEYGIMARGFDNIQRFFVLDVMRKQALGAKTSGPCGSSEIHQLLFTPAVSSSKMKPASNVYYSSPTLRLYLEPVITTSICQPRFISNSAQSPVCTDTPSPNSSCHDGWTISTVTPQHLSTIDGSLHKYECVFAKCSAVMLAFSRWLHYNRKKSEKPSVANRIVEAPGGIRLLQLYCACIDKVISYCTHLQPNPPTRLDISALIGQKCHRCDSVQCISVHIRDDDGHFIKWPCSNS